MAGRQSWWRWVTRSLTITGSVMASVVVSVVVVAGCGVFGGDDQAAPDPVVGDELPATTEPPSPSAAPSVSVSPSISALAVATDSTSSTTATTSTVVTTSVSTTATSPTSASTTLPLSTTPTNPSTASATTSTTAPTTSTTGNTSGRGCRASATICVGPDQRFTTLAAAVAAAGEGAVIELVPGRYNETAAVTAANVTIRSAAGGRSTVDCSGLRPANGKACLLAVGPNLTIEDLVVTGARGPDDNEACFRNEPGVRVTIRRVECHGSNNGILGSGGSWLIEDSHFHDNGAGDGFSHNLYLSGDCSEVIFRRSTSERARGGHAFKSRCRTSTIEGSTLRDNAVADAAEFSYGGAVTISDTTIHQPAGANGNIVRHGAEGCRHSGRLLFVNATISSDRPQGYIRSACATVGFDRTTLPSGIEVTEP